MISLFYAILLLSSGIVFMISGHDAVKRDRAKGWLTNIIIMIVLIQASFFLYQLTIDLSAAMTSASLGLIDEEFFLITLDGIEDIGFAILASLLYISSLILTALILVIRYAFVAIGVVLLPIAIFFYFIPPLKSYGSLILNFLGIAIFITFFDAILLIGFSQLVELSVFSDMKILVLIAAFMCINSVMLLLIFFSVVKAAASVVSDVKRVVKVF